MALRYAMNPSCPDTFPPDGGLPAWLAREPVAVNHNKDKDPRKTACEILRNDVSDLHAAVGAGKSTLIPRAIAAESNNRVYMIVPSQLLATQLYDYATTNPQLANDGVTSYLCEDVTKDLPETGVVYVGGANMVSLLLTRGFSNILIGKIIFLDEAHESDAFSYVLRNLGVQMGAKHLIRASATLCIDMIKAPRSPTAEIEEGTYGEEETPETWDLEDSTKPWFYQQTGNTMIYTDSDTEAALLKAKYEKYGYRAYRLTSKTSVSEFRQVMSVLDGPYATVIITDYSFRSGFTFNVTNVIDTGRVYFMSSKSGECKKACRSVYEFEVAQARGRVGRIPGLSAKYTRVEGKLEKIRTDLEGVEAEAAAYLYRLLGFKPTHVLAGRVMAKMFLPRDVTLVQAMNGPQPLTCYALQSTPPQDFADDKKPDFEAKLDEESVPLDPPEREVLRSKFEMSSHMPNAEDPWETLVDGYRTKGDTRLEEGVPYYARHIPQTIEAEGCEIFPDGHLSVTEFAMSNPNRRNLWTMLAEEERLFAVAVMLRRYNALLIEARAMRQALTNSVKEVPPEHGTGTVRRTFGEIASEVRQAEIHRRDAFRTMCRFLSYSGELTAHDFVGEVVATRTSQYFTKYREALMRGMSCNADKYFATYREGFTQPLTGCISAARTDEVMPAYNIAMPQVRRSEPLRIAWSQTGQMPIRYSTIDYRDMRFGGDPTVRQVEEYVKRRASAASDTSSSGGSMDSTSPGRKKRPK